MRCIICNFSLCYIQMWMESSKDNVAKYLSYLSVIININHITIYSKMSDTPEGYLCLSLAHVQVGAWTKKSLRQSAVLQVAVDECK